MEGRGRLSALPVRWFSARVRYPARTPSDRGHPACGQSASLSQALVSCGSLPSSVSGPDVRSTSPCGNVIGSSPKLVIEAQPLARRYAMVPPGNRWRRHAPCRAGLPEAIRDSGRWSATHVAMPARGGTGSAWNPGRPIRHRPRNLCTTGLRQMRLGLRVCRREAEGAAMAELIVRIVQLRSVGRNPRQRHAAAVTAFGAGGTGRCAMRTDPPAHPTECRPLRTGRVPRLDTRRRSRAAPSPS